ncbi:MAG: hypothetical protein ACK4UN_02885, partial [Limisphaerales bacterium]
YYQNIFGFLGNSTVESRKNIPVIPTGRENDYRQVMQITVTFDEAQRSVRNANSTSSFEKESSHLGGGIRASRTNCD